LAFSGGITDSRGHEGDNDGADAILEIVSGPGVRAVARTPVFGCTLFDGDGNGKVDE
jgi:hypothetical protein